MRKFYKSKVTNKTPDYELSEQEKNKILQSAYLGKKGYTILKIDASENELNFLRKDLFMKPLQFGVPSYGDTPDSEFPTYRENTNKMYIPRFYGIKRYGLPSKCEIDQGININIPFVKELRDYQTNVVDIFKGSVSKQIYEGSTELGGGGILQLYTGAGKTVIALKIISELKKKTLIIVHKEFLMNQWIERIEEFLPNAKIGKIQASICDYKEKDIVIGMVQTMYSKDFPQELYNEFGLTIVDEVHRISSEQFSRTLLKIITPYMLGISATVKRKDGLERVLYDFIGPIVYAKERDGTDIVSVRAIHYTSNDVEFNEVETDFRGNVKYSTMISKLCAFNPRSDFIVRVLSDLIIETPKTQIMVLAHNRCLLTYLYDSIQKNNITTVGYYVGGMKDIHLKETESKQIVLATYSMAAEALDIKTLSTLVMVTPKTDIVQSVGRILRMKHDNPIIVDIVDLHDVFKNQWKQRKTFYKKSNYRIFSIDSKEYTNMDIDWTNNKTWSLLYEPVDPSVLKTKSKVVKQTQADEDDAPKKCLIDIGGLEFK